MRKIVVRSISYALLVSFIFADGPSESQNIEYGDIAEFILKNSQGILSVEIASLERNRIATYTLVGNKMQPSDSISVFETLPISNYGYPFSYSNPPKGLIYSVFRYPIIEKLEEYIRIVSQCRTGETLWVKTSDIKPLHRAMIILFEELPTENVRYYFDLRFNPREYVRIYESPSLESEYKDIPQHFYISSKTWFRIDKQVGEFIHVFSQWSECGARGPAVDIGWLPIRDKSGNLNFWIYDFNDC